MFTFRTFAPGRKQHFLRFETCARGRRPISMWNNDDAPSIIFPKGWGKDDENGEDFETTDEHQRRAKPFDARWKHRPAHCGTDFEAERRADVADGTQDDGDGVGVVNARGDDDERGHEAEHEVDGEKGKQRDAVLHGNVIAVDVNG